MTLRQPDIPQHSDYESKEFYLKESLRLSELQIENQHRSSAILERKAVLLITLYVAIIASTFTWGIGGEAYDKENQSMVISLLFITFFILAIAFSVSVLHIRSFRVLDANSEYFLQESFRYDFNKMAEHLLKKYDEIFEFNKKVLAEKRKDLKISLLLGYGSAILAGLWIIANLVKLVS